MASRAARGAQLDRPQHRAAFASRLLVLVVGLASATVPPPACTCATPSLTTTVRMWMQVSRSPV